MNKVLCFFGFHNWVQINENKKTSAKKGYIIYFSTIHKCLNCGMKKEIGYGGVI
jgi:hypothetical protein